MEAIIVPTPELLVYHVSIFLYKHLLIPLLLVLVVHIILKQRAFNEIYQGRVILLIMVADLLVWTQNVFLDDHGETLLELAAEDLQDLDIIEELA